MSFICPVCKQPLARDANCLACTRKHSFDIAKSGYVNLLMSQQTKQKRHGDDKAMVAARRRFLQKGYYNSLAAELCRLAKCHFPGGTLLDAGCGEGWYTQQIAKQLQGSTRQVLAIDISKNALEIFGKQQHDISCAVASIFDIPVADKSCGMVLNIFAPLSLQEYRRVLRKGGILLLAVPLPRHLFGLKQAVYDKPYENALPDSSYDGFVLLEQSQIKEALQLCEQQDILDLFMMTPYYYKTGRQDFEKLLQLTQLETELAFGVFVLQRK